EKHEYLNTIRILYFTGYLIICTLGLVLNLFVIIACSWNHLKSDTAKWVLALAVTHLIFSAFLPLQILYSWYHFNWHYGAILCKVSSYVFYASLFSTAGILSFWTVKDSIERFECKRKHCLTFKHSTVVLILILCSWTLAAILSIPSLYSRELRYSDLGEQCIDDYDLNDDTTTVYGKRNQELVSSYRFVLGILIPAFLIAICLRCQRQSMERKYKQITCLIKIAYIVCWTPLLLMVLLQAFSTFDGHPYGLPVATVLATAHCCVNPMIYLLVSHDIKMKWMK
ncbi:chemokine-like receptor 1, partial [Silurus asotus]